MKRTFGRVAATGAACLLAAGCATSSNPREGGLIGYWATGEGGYQRRLDERQGALEGAHAEADAERGQSAALEQDRGALREQLREQRQAMAVLQSEIDRLRAECDDLEAADKEQEEERAFILGELESAERELQGLRGDSTTLVAEKQRRIDALKAEVNLLLERYSLLTTL
jgi:chromosome segregation ATPase